VKKQQRCPAEQQEDSGKSRDRKHLLLQAVHPYLVVTDVTNFFDSLLHSHVEEALRGLPVAPRMVGLLFFLRERLSIRQALRREHKHVYFKRERLQQAQNAAQQQAAQQVQWAGQYRMTGQRSFYNWLRYAQFIWARVREQSNSSTGSLIACELA